MGLHYRYGVLLRAAMLLALAALAPAAAAAPAQGAHHAATPYVGAAFAPDGTLWTVQLDEHARLVLQQSADQGRSWLAARVLDTGADPIKSSGESPPGIVFGPNGVVIVSYAKPLERKYTGEIRMLRSTDGGAHFAAPVTLHQDRQQTSHAYAAMAFDAGGALHTVWIDGRDKAAATAAAAPTDPAYRGVTLYRNVSRDGGATFGPDTRFAEHSCECCRIGMAAAPGGQLALLWRQVSEPNIRDHAFTLLGGASAGTAAAPVVRASYDNWAVDACPHHGPALTMAAAGGYHAVWFGVRDGLAQVRYGRLDASGAPLGAVQALPDSGAEHADILASGKRLAIVWRSFDGQAMRLKAWISDDDGQHFRLRELASSTLDTDYPRLFKHRDQLFVIWNTSGARHVEAL